MRRSLLLFEKYARKESERECSAAYIINHDDANGVTYSWI